MNLKEELTNGKGYHIFERFIPAILVSDIKNILKDLYPVRASSSTKIYKEREEVQTLNDISVWWSQSLNDFKVLKKIKSLVDPIVQSNFNNLEFYASDMVVINAGSKWISPHVDTPHRFQPWNYDKRLLGVQCIISLSNLDENSASTGLVPYSQKRDFEINKCYTSEYDRWFLDNCKQHKMPKGSLLMYNCRVLHSSMPNPTPDPRPALLINYLDKSIMNDVRLVDNVWTSNGKSS